MIKGFFSKENIDNIDPIIFAEQLKIALANLNPQQPQNAFEKHLQKAKIKHLPAGRRVLEIGCGDGSVFEGTNYLADGYDINEEVLKVCKKVPNYIKVSSDIRNFYIPEYDCVCLLGVLEHMEEREITSLLDNIKEAKHIYITVPNAESFHRLVGLKLGLIDSPAQLSEADRKIGHKRYYTLYEVLERVSDFKGKNDFELKRYGTLGFKFDTSVNMVKYLDRIEAIESVAETMGLIGEKRLAISNRYTGAEIYVLLKKSKKDG